MNNFSLNKYFPSFKAVTAGLLSTYLSLTGIAESQTDVELLELELEDLLDVQVISASKKEQALTSVASAMFVISAEDVKRAGVTSIPEALRLAPGIQVARIDSNKWAISSRGFNGHFSNKLLVMIDGRTIYTPTYSGVYWETHDVALDDLERIEVIRGPGGSIWGANAVNGVINIITKHSADSLGQRLSFTSGNFEEALAYFRSGTKLGKSTYGRMSLSTNHRGDLVYTDGSSGYDSWSNQTFSSRIDSQINEANAISILANYTEGDINQEILYSSYEAPYLIENISNVEYTAHSLLTRWDHTHSANNTWTLQLYYDYTDRQEFFLDNKRDTYDVDFTHRFNLTNHNIVWGLGYRLLDENLTTTELAVFSPESRDNEQISVFIQDQFDVYDNLSVTIGAKWEHHYFTSNEFQPSLKLSWNADNNSQIWASIAQSVRTPFIFEKDVTFTVASSPPICNSPAESGCSPALALSTLVKSTPSNGLVSEELVAYEIGARHSFNRSFDVDLTLFYHDYSKLRTLRYDSLELVTNPSPYLLVLTDFTNDAYGYSHGIELASRWSPIEQTMISLNYSYIDNNFTREFNFDIHQNTAAPRHQISLQSHWTINADLETNLTIRYVDDAEVVNGVTVGVIDSYTAVDWNLIWQLNPSIEFRLVGQNLFDSSHAEYLQEIFLRPSEVTRSYYGQITINF